MAKQALINTPTGSANGPIRPLKTVNAQKNQRYVVNNRAPTGLEHVVKIGGKSTGVGAFK